MINIFLLCFNESVLIEHTIKHYKKNFPSCQITIYDNESQDNSVEIAKSLGCNIIVWSSNNINDEKLKIDIRNNCWKTVESGWVIVADMDEWLCITEEELNNEKNLGTTILLTKGVEIIGTSNTLDLSDIDLHSIDKYFDNVAISKYSCFLRDSITDMNFGPGSHKSKPEGVVNYSTTIYVNKHMSFLGLPYYKNKVLTRYERSELNRSRGWSLHYVNDIEKIEFDYHARLKQCKKLL
jgi:Glycosyl transferase family 2